MTTTPTTLLMTAPIQVIEAAAGEGGEGKLPRFSMVAYTGAAMRLEGWPYPVVVALDGVQVPDRPVPIRYAHSGDRQDGIGHTDSVLVDANSVLAAGVFSRDTDAAREVIASAKRGFPWQASIGATPTQVSFLKAGETATVNGRQVAGPAHIVHKSRLNEISIVDLGADSDTTTRVAATGGTQGGKDMADETTPAVATGEPAEIIARAKAERERQAGIQALAEEYTSIRGVDIAGVEKIIAEAQSDPGKSVRDTELQLLRATRPRAVAPARSKPAPTQAVLEAALCLSAGVKDEVLAKDRDYGEKVVEQAWPMRNRGLRGVLAAALESQGVAVPHGGSDFYATLMESSRIRAAGGFSTINLPGLIGNVANKMLLEMFLEFQTTYDVIANQADFANFHTHTIYRLDHLGGFQKVGADGELKHGNLAESNYTNKVDTWGQVLGFSRQAFINDDLNAFKDLLRSLARKSRIAPERELYTNCVLEGSDAFYTTGQLNKITSNALSITALGAAEAAMMLMADQDGEPIFGTPRYLLVPPGLKPLADSIFVSAELNETTTANVGKPMNNPYRGRFMPVTSPYLAMSSLSGYSATTWYLLADPRMLPAFQVAYLDGRRSPVIETADAQFNTLGLQMRAYFDFGVAKIDYRGAIKNVA